MPTHTTAIVIPGYGFNDENRIFRERTSGSTRTRWVSEYSEHRRPATRQRGICSSSLEQAGPDFSKARVTAENRALEIVQEGCFLPAPAQSTEVINTRGIGAFCQLRGDPLIGVFGADADARGGDDDDVAVGEIGERVDFVATVDGEGAAAEEEEGDVRAEAAGDADEASERDALFCEAKHGDHRGCGVTGAAAEAAGHGDDFFEARVDAAGVVQLFDHRGD